MNTNQEIKEAFPLSWPTGYKRCKSRIRSRFNQTMDQSQRSLRNEITRLQGTSLIVSSNIPVRNDGGMYASHMNKKIEDPGVAIYFKYKGKDISMCCDQYERVWENIYALAKGIEALRAMERWGVSDFIDRAFSGFTAIAERATSSAPWSEVLEVSPAASPDEIKRSYYRLARIHHPDNGGDAVKFKELADAYFEAQKTFPKNK